jgi:hypothetical protein
MTKGGGVIKVGLGGRYKGREREGHTRRRGTHKRERGTKIDRDRGDRLVDQSRRVIRS